MKIFAVRDRLIDYFEQPFAAHTPQEVLAALSLQMARPQSHYAQAPHHYDLWQIGQVDDQGNITAEKLLIATLDAVVRPGVRKATPEPGGDNQAGSAPSRSRSPAERTSEATGADPSALQSAPQGEDQQGKEQHSGHNRSAQSS